MYNFQIFLGFVSLISIVFRVFFIKILFLYGGILIRVYSGIFLLEKWVFFGGYKNPTICKIKITILILVIENFLIYLEDSKVFFFFWVISRNLYKFKDLFLIRARANPFTWFVMINWYWFSLVSWCDERWRWR